MVKIKFCGMTNEDDCLAAADLGVDFVGFVFYRRSPRFVSAGKVREIAERLEGRIKTVGVFVEEGEEAVAEIVDFCRLDFAQVYRPVRAKNRISVIRVKDRVPEVDYDGLILFDAFTEAFGGSGRRMDLGLLKESRDLKRAFIAGGLDEDNIVPALLLEPFGIDLATSIEKHKRKKDMTKMKRFVNKVRSFER